MQKKCARWNGYFLLGIDKIKQSERTSLVAWARHHVNSQHDVSAISLWFDFVILILILCLISTNDVLAQTTLCMIFFKHYLMNSIVKRFITVRKRSCHSVRWRGGGVCPSACWDTHPPGRHPPGQTPPGQTPPWEDTPPRHTQPPPPQADGYCCGWHASYWNAFLFYMHSISKRFILHANQYTNDSETNIVVYGLLPPANEVCKGYVFTRVCHSVHGGSTWAGTPFPDRYTPGRTPPGQVHPLGRYTLLPGRYTPRPQCVLGYGQQASGTHPTGMHSCFRLCFDEKQHSTGASARAQVDSQDAGNELAQSTSAPIEAATRLTHRSIGGSTSRMSRQFRWISKDAPGFRVRGDDIDVLPSPSAFYDTLKVRDQSV